MEEPEKEKERGRKRKRTGREEIGRKVWKEGGKKKSPRMKNFVLLRMSEFVWGHITFPKWRFWGN